MSYRFSPILALLFALALLALGVGGYIWLEDYTFADALYMVVITVATIGYGEPQTLSNTGRMFTIGYILVSFVSMGVIGRGLMESALEGFFSGTRKNQKMRKKIDELQGHYILCGFGQVGRAVAEDLLREKVEFVVVNQDEQGFDQEPFNACLHLTGDATQEHVLLDAGIKRAKGLITMINSDPTNLYIVLTSRELNPVLHIVSRAEDQHSIKRIKQGGADQVISTYLSVGQRIVDVVLMHSGKAGTKTFERRKPQAPQWIEVHEGSAMIGQDLGSLTQQMGKEILGLRQNGRDWIQPPGHLCLNEGDAFLVMEEPGTPGQPKPETGAAPKKVVLVDDNLVILRLYTRLFQKAGYFPLTAQDGEEGLALIKKELPEIAVIDYQLPKLSGIEVCRQLRRDPVFRQTKLVLFTGDDKPETRASALAAGADEVIPKTPDAFAIIKKVIELHGPQSL